MLRSGPMDRRGRAGRHQPSARRHVERVARLRRAGKACVAGGASAGCYNENLPFGAARLVRESLVARAPGNSTQHRAPGLAGVAQLVRARGSYPRSPGFKSLHRHQRRVG